MYDAMLRIRMGIPNPDALSDDAWCQAVGFMLYLFAPEQTKMPLPGKARAVPARPSR